MKGDYATPYESGARVAPRADNSCKAGAGGLAGTAEDLARFGLALLDGTLLSAEELVVMTAPVATADGKPNEYGLGIVHTTDPILGKIFIHSGGALGGRSYLLLAPDHKIVVALASNVEGEGLRPQALAIAQAFMAEKKHGVR